jgi:hypothetical protein
MYLTEEIHAEAATRNLAGVALAFDSSIRNRPCRNGSTRRSTWYGLNVCRFYVVGGPRESVLCPKSSRREKPGFE